MLVISLLSCQGLPQNFVASERMKIMRFEEGSAFFIRNQLADQPIKTYQELYERAAQVEGVKNELRSLNPGNSNRKWSKRRASSESLAQKKPISSSAKSHIMVSCEPCGKCSRTNYITLECCVDITSVCGAAVPSIRSLPILKDKVMENGVVRPRQTPTPLKPTVVGRGT